MVPAQPISVTVLTSYWVSCRFNGRGTHSSSRIRIFREEGSREHVLGDVQNGDRLFLFDAGEVVEEFIQGISGCQIVQQGFDGDTGADEDRSSTEDVRIAVNDR